jgi:hypothetical protein
MTVLPLPLETPSEELHALIELGYAAKDKRLREAAGVVNTWAGKLPFYLQIIEEEREKQ